MYPIKNEHDYEIAIDALNHLMDLGGVDENHPLARLVTALGIFIESYEQHLSTD
jgi:antitoxin component HigA of HigAB toxin-antitoxin module